MKYTVYKITNLINNKIYIGCHITSDLNDSYMGSGKIICQAIKKYGINSFKKEILFILENETEMFIREKKLISKFNPDYNLHKGGNGGFTYINNNKISVNNFETRETAQKASKRAQEVMKELRKNTPQWEINKAKKSSETLKRKYKSGEIKPGFLGKKHTEKFKQNKSKTMSIKQKGELNSHYGRKHSQKAKNKISESLKKYYLSKLNINGV